MIVVSITRSSGNSLSVAYHRDKVAYIRPPYPAFAESVRGIGLFTDIGTTSRRLSDRKVEKFEKNIKKRGAVHEASTKKGNSYPVGPILLGFFVFVVIGSSLFQIIRTATSGGMA